MNKEQTTTCSTLIKAIHGHKHTLIFYLPEEALIFQCETLLLSIKVFHLHCHVYTITLSVTALSPWGSCLPLGLRARGPPARPRAQEISGLNPASPYRTRCLYFAACLFVTYVLYCFWIVLLSPFLILCF